MSTLLLTALFACTTKTTVIDDSASGISDTAADTASSDTSSVDTSPPPECNTDNEECVPDARGCGGEGANMLPGSDCLACHSDGAGGRERAPVWSAGGTLFNDIYGSRPVSGATVRVTDASGRVVTMRSSSSGNFYTATRLLAPMRAEVELADGTVFTMGREIDEANCNSCHSCDGEAGGKIYAE